MFSNGLERQTVYEDYIKHRIGAFTVGEVETDSLLGNNKGGKETVLGTGTTSGVVVYVSLFPVAFVFAR